MALLYCGLLYFRLFEGVSVPPSNYLIYSGFRKVHFTFSYVLSKYDKMELESHFYSTSMYDGVYTY